MDNNIPKGCKPFDLEKAMAGEPVVTRDGRPYKFGAYNPDAKFPIIGWIELSHQAHKIDGSWLSDSKSNADLFMAAKTQKVWVSLFLSKTSGSIYANAYQDHDKAVKDSHDTDSFAYLKTIETEVEL